MSDFATRMADADVRFEHLFWLPGIVADPPREFEEFVEDELWDSERLLRTAPWLAEWSDAEPGELPAEMVNRGMTGFLAQLARPFPSKFSKDGKSFTSSWGHYRTEWVYAATLEELCDLAEKWSEEVIAEARNKAA